MCFVRGRFGETERERKSESYRIRPGNHHNQSFESNENSCSLINVAFNCWGNIFIRKISPQTCRRLKLKREIQKNI